MEQDDPWRQHHRSGGPGQNRKPGQSVRHPQQQQPVPNHRHVAPGQHHRDRPGEQVFHLLLFLPDRRTLRESDRFPELLPERRVALDMEPIRGQDRTPRLFGVGSPIPFGEGELGYLVGGLHGPPEPDAVEPLLGEKALLQRPMGLGECAVPREDAADPLADVQRCGLAPEILEFPLDLLEDGLRLPPAHRDGRHRTGRQLEGLQPGSEADPAGLRAENHRAGGVAGHLPIRTREREPRAGSDPFAAGESPPYRSQAFREHRTARPARARGGSRRGSACSCEKRVVSRGGTLPSR